MRKGVRYIIGLLTGVLPITAGCINRPPVEELATASVALQNAAAAQANTHAGDQYRSAENLLKQAYAQTDDKEYEAALRLSRAAALQAQYSIAVTQWRIKSDTLKRNQAALQTIKAEVDKLQAEIDDVKKRIQ